MRQRRKLGTDLCLDSEREVDFFACTDCLSSQWFRSTCYCYFFSFSIIQHLNYQFYQYNVNYGDCMHFTFGLRLCAQCPQIRHLSRPTWPTPNECHDPYAIELTKMQMII